MTGIQPTLQTLHFGQHHEDSGIAASVAGASNGSWTWLCVTCLTPLRDHALTAG